MTNATTGNVTVNYTLTGVTALSGIDYQHTGGTITITAGTTGATRVLATSGDTIYEGDETFHFILSSPSSNASISDATGVVTITDNESLPSIDITDTAAFE